ncbi:unnamed protein product [Prunus brigantina]
MDNTQMVPDVSFDKNKEKPATDSTEKYEEEHVAYEPSADNQIALLETEKFRVAEGQENTMEGDVFSQETLECKLAEVEEGPKHQKPVIKTGRTTMKLVSEQLCFSKPAMFIIANFGGVPIPKAMVDGGTTINLLLDMLLVKWAEQRKILSQHA